MKSNPLVTIITVVYNAKDDFLSTLENIKLIKSQREVEYIVVDGKSTDGTLELIEENLTVIDKYISEKDNGIFDAMNKGINLATSRWLIFINAGDLIIETALEKINLEKNNHAALVYGNTIRNNGIKTTPYELKMIEVGALPACHQSMFYNKDILKKELYYNTKYKLFGENELMMRLYTKKYKMIYQNVDIAFFQGGGISDSVNNEVRKAKLHFVAKYFGIIGIIKFVLYHFGVIKFKATKTN